MINSDQLIEKIQPAKVVSFDIFDTLLKRDFDDPKDLFFALQAKITDHFQQDFANFHDQRIAAEKRAREIQQGEVTLDEIYQVLIEEGTLTTEQATWVKEQECALEVSFCTPNLNMLPVYEYCLQAGKKVIIVSDMYLPRATLTQMLTKIGVTDYERLWISNESGNTKADGSLFDEVAKALEIEPNQITHIGDNQRSDIVQAKKHGWNALSIPTKTNQLRYPARPATDWQEKQILAFINNRVQAVAENQQLGFETMGPLLYGYVTWLMSEFRQAGLKEIFFLARDGQIMKKAFDLVNTNHEFNTHYLYASRRAFQVPVLANQDVSMADFAQRLHWPPKVTVNYFLYTLGIEDPQTVDELKQRHQIPADHAVRREELLNDQLLTNLFEQERPLITQNAQDELDSLMAYLQEEHVSGPIGVVDIGWRGNMQLNLESLLREQQVDCQVSGYYIGVTPGENHADEISMKGYVFDRQANEEYLIEKTVNSLFEQIFMASHGSVKRMQKQANGKIEPVLYPEEQTDVYSRELLTEYQKGALKFITEFSQQYGEIQLSGAFAIGGVFEQFIAPLTEDALAWSRLKFKDVQTQALVAAQGINFWRHPKQFARAYKQSVWKEGFLRLNLNGQHNLHQLAERITRFREWQLKK